MAASLGPNLIEDGLILSLDAGDINSVMGATVEVLVVAGGGGGGMDMGGGGGGGGVIYNPSYAVTQGTPITVTVGNGGYGAPAGGTYRGDGVGPQPTSHQFTVSATQGGNSVFGSLTAIGGGFGASSYYGYLPNSGVGGTGGSGGGCSGYTHGGERYVDGTFGSTANNTAGQGFPGGNSGNPTTGADDHYSGGGGGAGGRGTSGPGHAGPNGIKANGGPGILYPTMSPYYFAGGGGGSGYSGDGGNGGIGGGGGGSASNGNIGLAGTGGINIGSNGSSGNNAPGGNAGANTGGGGGGGSHYNSNNKGGDGGSGIVIVRYSGPQKATGGTVSTVAGYTIHTFTSSGTFTPNSNWYDTSGNGNNGTISNATFSSTNSGIFTFGANASITKTSSTVNLSAGLSVELMFKSTDMNSRAQGFMQFNTSAGHYINFYTSGNGRLRFEVLYPNPTNGGSFLTAQTLSNNTWYNAVGTFVNGAATIYINGIYSSNASYNAGNFSATHTGNIVIGEYAGYMSGNIAFVRIYNKALTASEVLQNYNSIKSRFGL